MNKYLFGLVFLASNSFASSTPSFTTEFLIGSSSHKLHASQDFDIGHKRSSSNNSTSHGIRFGLPISEYFSVELSKHFYGEADHSYILKIPSGFIHDYVFKSIPVSLPIETNALKFGIKGHVNINAKLNVNLRVGLANWRYKQYSPAMLVINDIQEQNHSGRDVYFSVGSEYVVSDSIYIGFEYSQFSIKETEQGVYTADVSYSHKINDLSLVLGWAF
ncbi:outer membrane beta-barrel protein [Pseudoalteromonas sp. BZB3]|uniref:outer membrane beta-barrel protein n=1 Tax=Pseudoalteromonas sp. BZB3 TaxID=3136670 RepID=UPI0032C3DA8F